MAGQSNGSIRDSGKCKVDCCHFWRNRYLNGVLITVRGARIKTGVWGGCGFGLPRAQICRRSLVNKESAPHLGNILLSIATKQSQNRRVITVIRIFCEGFSSQLKAAHLHHVRWVSLFSFIAARRPQFPFFPSPFLRLSLVFCFGRLIDIAHGNRDSTLPAQLLFAGGYGGQNQ